MKVPANRSLRSMAALLTLAVSGTGSLKAQTQQPSGELVIIDWQLGGLHRMLREVEAQYMRTHPGVKIREVSLNPTGDARMFIRDALKQNTKADLLFSAWPAFRAELAMAGQLRSIDKAWDTNRWRDNIADKWRTHGQFQGVTYEMTYTYDYRSGIFYRKDVLRKAGLAEPPKTWDSFLASFKKFRAAGITPVAIPAKVWAHAEWFESSLLRVGGVEAAGKLAAHKIKWTDPVVKSALKKYAEMLKADCCDPPAKMLAAEWDNAADYTLKDATHGFELIGMWVNERAKNDYQLAEGQDYALMPFPSMGMGHDDTSSINTRGVLALKSGANPAAADSFLGWMVGPEASAIMARNGFSSVYSKMKASLYGPVTAASVKTVAASKSQFVLGDLLPGDLVDVYRTELQHFLQDPSDENIDKVLATIEAKAATAYP